MAIDAGKVIATLELETGAFAGGVNTAKGLIQSLSSDTATGRDKMLALGQAASSLGKTLTTAVTLPLTALGTASVAAFASFDDAMRQVRATMGLYDESNAAVAADIEALTNAAQEMGRTTRYSAGEAASALNYLALAGYNADQAISALPTVLRLAQAGGIDLALASDMVTDSMSALGLEMEQLDTFVDQLAVTSQKSNTSVSQLGQAILTVGATAKNLAGGTAELNAELGILADSGIKGAEGGTHLRNVILALTQPTESGAKALKKYTQGVYDAEGNIRSLDAVLGELKASMAGMSQAEQNSVINDIFNKTDLAAAQVLIAGAGERFAELTGYIEDAEGAAEGMAEVMEGGIGGAFRSLKSATEGAAIAIGEELAPMVNSAAEFVTELVNGFNALDEGTRSTIVTIGTIAATVGPALLIIGKLTTALASINPVVAGVTLGVTGLTAAVYALSHIPSWRQTVDGKLGLAVDESELENYKVPTDPINGGEVPVDVSITIRNNAKSAMEQIMEILNDGKPEDEKDYDTMCASVFAIIDGVEKSIQDYWDDKRATLKALFEAGLIDKDELDKQMAEYDAKQKEMETNLQTNAQAVTDYIAALVEANRAPTEAEIAHLQGLIDKLADVGVAAAEATQQVENAYRMSYERMTTGNAVEGDAERAATYVEMKAANARAAADAALAQADAEAAADIAAGGYAPGSPEYQAIMNMSLARRAGYDARMTQIDADRDAMYREMALGALGGQNAGYLQSLFRDWHANDRMLSAVDAYGSDPLASGWYSLLRTVIDPGDEAARQGKIKEYQGNLEHVGEILDEFDLEKLRDVTALWQANGGGGNYDLSTTGGMIAAMNDLLGWEPFSQMTNSEAWNRVEDTGVIADTEAKYEAAADAIDDAADAIDDAADTIEQTSQTMSQANKLGDVDKDVPVGGADSEKAAQRAADAATETTVQASAAARAAIAAAAAAMDSGALGDESWEAGFESQAAETQAALDAAEADAEATKAAVDAVTEAVDAAADSTTGWSEDTVRELAPTAEMLNEMGTDLAREGKKVTAFVDGVHLLVDDVTGEIVEIGGQAVEGIGDTVASSWITSKVFGDRLISFQELYAAAGAANGDAYVAAWNEAMGRLFFPQPIFIGGTYYSGYSTPGSRQQGTSRSDVKTYNNNVIINTETLDPRQLKHITDQYSKGLDTGRGSTTYITPT